MLYYYQFFRRFLLQYIKIILKLQCIVTYASKKIDTIFNLFVAQYLYNFTIIQNKKLDGSILVQHL